MILTPSSAPGKALHPDMNRAGRHSTAGSQKRMLSPRGLKHQDLPLASSLIQKAKTQSLQFTESLMISLTAGYKEHHSGYLLLTKEIINREQICW